jgi:hypothetical protein
LKLNPKVKEWIASGASLWTASTPYETRGIGNRDRRGTTALLWETRRLPQQIPATLSGSSRTGSWRRRAEAARVHLELSERAQSSLEAELSEERRRREAAERERDAARRELEALHKTREEAP